MYKTNSLTTNTSLILHSNHLDHVSSFQTLCTKKNYSFSSPCLFVCITTRCKIYSSLTIHIDKLLLKTESTLNNPTHMFIFSFSATVMPQFLSTITVQQSTRSIAPKHTHKQHTAKKGKKVSQLYTTDCLAYNCFQQ